MLNLYTTGCPKCIILKKKLNEKNIEYVEINDIKQMIAMGLKSVPWLEVNGQMMDFNQANQWINAQ